MGRIVRRAAVAGDLGALVDHFARPPVYRHLWDGAPAPREAVAALLDASDVDFRTKGYGVWLLEEHVGSVVPAPSGAGTTQRLLVGMVALRAVPGHDGRVEVVYSLEPEHWGRGVATAAAAEVLTHGFDACGLHEILGGVDAPNVASAAVLRRLGMEPIGPLLIDGDVVHFSAIGSHAFAARRPLLPTLATLDGSEPSERRGPG